MNKYFIAVAVTNKEENYFEFFNFDVKLNKPIENQDEIYFIEEHFREDLVKNGIIPQETKLKYNINVLNWRKFEQKQRKKI